MPQFRKAITVIDNCKDCPCNIANNCSHNTVRTIYRRILEYYPDSTYGDCTDAAGNPTIAFSERDKLDISIDGFPFWCPLERSK